MRAVTQSSGELRPVQQESPRGVRPRRPVVSYERIAVCLSPSDASVKAVELACKLAVERRAHVTAIAVVEVPLDVPLGTPDKPAESAAREALHRAQAIGASFGISIQGVILHARDTGVAIVAEITVRRAEVVVVAAEWPVDNRKSRLLGGTTDYVLKHSPSRVMLIGAPAASDRAKGTIRTAEPVFRSGVPSEYWPSGEFIDKA